MQLGPSVRQLLGDPAWLGQTVEVRGWVRSRRDSKGGFSFVALNDGSCRDNLQLVVPGELDNYDSDCLRLTTGCSVVARGELVPSQGKGQTCEVQVQALTVCGWVDDPENYPIAKKRHSFEYLRSVAHLRPRTNTFAAIARLRTAVASAIHGYFASRDFQWVNTPLITANDCEGAGELFRVSTLDLSNLPKTAVGAVDFGEDFFGREAFLTVSGQLNVEAYCLALSRVYTFGPTFRAENSNTSRHLAEFWMVEPELAFADLNDDCDLAEDFLRAVVSDVLRDCGDDLALFDEFVESGLLQRLRALSESGFERISYSDAVERLQASGQSFEFPVSWGMDLQSEHERWLCEKHVGGPVVVTDYPKDIKAFYMRLNDDGKTVAAMDVLAPGIGEIIGGAQREERLSVLDERTAECGIDTSGLEWYRDLRRYGTVPHAGFGLGFERLLNYLTGMDNIRDVIPFPRSPKHADY